MQETTEELQAGNAEPSKTPNDTMSKTENEITGDDASPTTKTDKYVYEIAVSNKHKTTLDVKHSVIDVLGPLHETEAYHEDNTRASLILAQHQRIICLEAELKEVWDLVKKLRVKLAKCQSKATTQKVVE